MVVGYGERERMKIIGKLVEIRFRGLNGFECINWNIFYIYVHFYDNIV